MNHVDVAVIGGGFSAASTVINLIEQLDPDRTVGVVGRTAGLGLGTAYSTKDDVHRLNVPAGRMSLYADRANDLCEWLDANGHGHGSEDFIPRKLFGAYVQGRLEEQLFRTDNRARVALQNAEAIDCEEFGDEQQVYHLSNGERLTARSSVFCIGGTPAGLPLPDDRIAREARKHICLNVWADPWMERAGLDDTVFMLGSGLTMVDQVMSLRRRGHRGRIHVVSRHGLLPQPHHVPRSHLIEAPIAPGGGAVSELMRRLREAARGTEDWRSAVDSIRPITQTLWQHFTPTERQRFLRHANSWWNIHRHRLAPDIRARLDEMQDAGQLTISAGWLQEVYETGGKARIAYRDRHTGTLRQISADWIVNCTGMEKCSISKVPLLKKMSARGMITGDNLGLGLAVGADSRILREDGSIAQTSYALGPMTIGQFFEIFAVPDIRVQAKNVAGHIAGRIHAA